VKSGKLNFEEPRQIALWTCFDRYPVRASAGALDIWVEAFSEPPRRTGNSRQVSKNAAAWWE
jgi:hypothetical protein